jgi:hypothetical protein
MIKIKVHTDTTDIQQYVHWVVAKSVKAAGGFTRTQHGAVENMLVRMLRAKIDSLSGITGEKARLRSSMNMYSTINYKLQQSEVTTNAFGYTYGLQMIWYGFMLGNQEPFKFSSSKRAIAEWIKQKMKLGVQFSACRWKKKKGANWRHYSASDYIKQCGAATEADAMMIASQMVNKLEFTRVIPNWFELGKDSDLWYDMEVNIKRSRNLIPAVTKRVIKEINKNNG